MLLDWRWCAEYLCRGNSAITGAHGKVGISNDTIENKQGGTQTITMLQQPAPRIAGEFGNQAQAGQVLSPAVYQRVTLRRIRPGER